MEPWRVGEEPGGYDASNVSYDKDEGNCSRAAVVWLYVIHSPRAEGGSDAKTAYDLEIQCTVGRRFVL